jgi:predicted O-methyltransferase YrrM
MDHPLVELRWAAKALMLPPAVARFQIRARRLARRTEDEFSLTSTTRPPDLRRLLALARGAESVVELGTATGWTAISLALASPRRTVTTYDPYERSEPRRYMELVDPSVRERIELVVAAGSDGPREPRPVDLLYIDSSHERAETVAEVQAWRPALSPGALIVFDDYGHPLYPGVAEAIGELGLAGERQGTLFVHRVPGPPRPSRRPGTGASR